MPERAGGRARERFIRRHTREREEDPHKSMRTWVIDCDHDACACGACAYACGGGHGAAHFLCLFLSCQRARAIDPIGQPREA
jgi:hypothetical protein